MRHWGHPSIPFLSAAITAMLLYRGMLSGFGFDNGAIFAGSLGAAALLAAVWATAYLLWPLRKE
jgi:hypothetical protein